jgi:hypothetical protein
VVAVTFALSFGCGAAPPRVAPPVAPSANDVRFTIAGVRRFALIGDGLTEGHDTIVIEVDAPAQVERVDVWVAGRAGVRLDGDDGHFRGSIAIGDLPAGTHEVLLAADGSERAFARITFERVHPYYVLMTTDWDYAEPSDQALARIDRMHEAHPDVRMTHFVGPYTFTDPAVSIERRMQIASWLRHHEQRYGAEVGLHIHPYCNFVQHAGVGCITDQSVRDAIDPSGYTILCAAYGEARFATLLDAAIALFQENGLDRPTTFRAGGWTASIETLRALASRGFVADTSALNWARMEEWIGRGNGELYRWNCEHWRPINDVSQPYYPSTNDALSSDAPTLSILEVPDNGIMVDYVSVEEMIEIFEANRALPGGPRTLVLGFHPSERFADDRHARVDGILAYADERLASHDRGPVVYARLRDMPRVFSAR